MFLQIIIQFFFFFFLVDAAFFVFGEPAADFVVFDLDAFGFFVRLPLFHFLAFVCDFALDAVTLTAELVFFLFPSIQGVPKLLDEILRS